MFKAIEPNRIGGEPWVMDGFLSQAPIVKSGRYNTRLAHWDEREEIFKLFHDNLVPVAKLKHDILTAARSIYFAIEQGRLLVVERNGQIIGCTAFIEGQYWYSPQPIIYDMGFFVIPEYRKTSATGRLLGALKAEAKRRGALLAIGAGTNDPTVSNILSKRHPMLTITYLVN